MTRLLLTASRVRAITAAARTEKDLEDALRRHRIRFHWTTSPGFLAARVPIRSGSVLVYRTAARSGPLRVSSAAPAGYPYPVPRFSWDD